MSKSTTVKINVLRQLATGEWVRVVDARAEYGEHGEKFNHSRFVLTDGEAFANALGEAIRNFGRNLATGGPVGVQLDFEDGSGVWRLESQRQTWDA